MAYGVPDKLTSLEEYIAWVKRKLGMPVMNVELANEQIVQELYDAVNFANEWGFGFGSFMDYHCFNLVAGQGEYQLPANVMAVTQVLDAGQGFAGGYPYSEYLWSNENFLVSNGTIGAINQSIYSNMSTGNSGLLTYYANMQMYDLIEMFFKKEFSFRYQEPRNSILLSPTPTKASACAIKVYKRELPLNLLNNYYVRELALGRCMVLWGSILNKYSLTLPGGSTVNGDDRIARGDKMIDTAIEKIEGAAEGQGYFTTG